MNNHPASLTLQKVKGLAQTIVHHTGDRYSRAQAQSIVRLIQEVENIFKAQDDKLTIQQLIQERTNESEETKDDS